MFYVIVDYKPKSTDVQGKSLAHIRDTRLYSGTKKDCLQVIQRYQEGTQTPSEKRVWRQFCNPRVIKEK